jgi:hypothetical protein
MSVRQKVCNALPLVGALKIFSVLDFPGRKRSGIKLALHNVS